MNPALAPRNAPSTLPPQVAPQVTGQVTPEVTPEVTPFSDSILAITRICASSPHETGPPRSTRCRGEKDARSHPPHSNACLNKPPPHENSSPNGVRKGCRIWRNLPSESAPPVPPQHLAVSRRWRQVGAPGGHALPNFPMSNPPCTHWLGRLVSRFRKVGRTRLDPPTCRQRREMHRLGDFLCDALTFHVHPTFNGSVGGPGRIRPTCPRTPAQPIGNSHAVPRPRRRQGQDLGTLQCGLRTADCGLWIVEQRSQ
jgi:hypothetical protein